MLVRIFYLQALLIFSLNLYGKSEVPEKFIGHWNISVVEKSSAFPWWQQVKYPVELIISSKGGELKDQNGFRCELESVIYDPDEDMIVFRHCGDGLKDAQAFDVLQIAEINNGKLIGNVMTYKTLFKWCGIRAKSKKSVD